MGLSMQTAPQHMRRITIGVMRLVLAIVSPSPHRRPASSCRRPEGSQEHTHGAKR